LARTKPDTEGQPLRHGGQLRQAGPWARTISRCSCRRSFETAVADLVKSQLVGEVKFAVFRTVDERGPLGCGEGEYRSQAILAVSYRDAIADEGHLHTVVSAVSVAATTLGPGGSGNLGFDGHGRSLFL